jgi:hypothetical protein
MMMTRLWFVLVVTPVLLLLAVTVAAEQPAEGQAAADLACLKLQLWASDDCAGDPDNTDFNTVPTAPSDDCGTCCFMTDR